MVPSENLISIAMKSPLPIGVLVVAAVLLGVAPRTGAQTSTPAKKQDQQPALVRAVGVMVDKDETAVEIVCSRPIPPNITKVDGPLRLVIDLPNSVLTAKSKRVDFHNDQISAIRMDQFQSSPATVRVVVDLLKPNSYRWDTLDNRLMIRLRPDAAAASAQPVTEMALTPGVKPVAIPVIPGATGGVLLAGNRIATGSSVTAGADTAILHLGRGGEVRVCPGTTVSVTSSQNGRALMLGMSTGSLEAHYSLDASADSVLTPDFRILMAGPGQFDYAISADSRGNTCVRALPGNTASVIVSELMGDGTYQVKPSEEVMFRSGQLTAIDSRIPAGCGCPTPGPPMMRAEAQTIPEVNADTLPSNMRLAQPGDPAQPLPPPSSTSGFAVGEGKPPAQVTLSVVAPETAPLPASQPNEVHVAVEAPFVYRASDAPQPKDAPIEESRNLRADYARPQPPFRNAVLGPPPPPPAPAPVPAQAKAEHHTVFGKIKGFFSAMFR
jgi:hypothetical protein